MIAVSIIKTAHYPEFTKKIAKRTKKNRNQDTAGTLAAPARSSHADKHLQVNIDSCKT
jgi:hypothetical protein